MSKVEEEDVSQLVANDELARDLQPHLSVRLDDDDVTVSPENVNPALDVDSEGHKQSSDTALRNTENAQHNTQAGNGDNRNGEVAVSTPPVYYSTRTGETNVVHEPVVIRQPNGIHVIRTRECCHVPNNYTRERPLKERHIKCLKTFSVVAIIIFFPLGIPAMYYAFKCEKEFHAGIQRGDIDLARKLAKRSERLMIFSVMAALLVAVAVFAVVERKLMEDDEEYWKNRNNNRILPTG